MDEERNCPACGASNPTLLGGLGATIWLRCRMCGWDYPMDLSLED